MIVPPAAMRVIAAVIVVGSAWVPAPASRPLGAANSVLPVGVDGVGDDGVPATSKSRKSTLGRPFAVVGLSRMVLLPEFTEAVRVLVTQVFQAPVPSNDGVCTVLPLTIRLAGRAVVVPLANRNPNVAVPAAEALTVNWAKAPTALVPLQKPVPENPAQLLSMVPVQTAGAFSASKRVGAASAEPAVRMPTAPANRAAVTAMSGLNLIIFSKVSAAKAVPGCTTPWTG